VDCFRECGRAILLAFILLKNFFDAHPFALAGVWVLLFAGFFLITIAIEIVRMGLDLFGGERHLRSRLKAFRKLKALGR
jgi:hypothetical protein